MAILRLLLDSPNHRLQAGAIVEGLRSLGRRKSVERHLSNLKRVRLVTSHGHGKDDLSESGKEAAAQLDSLQAIIDRASPFEDVCEVSPF